MVVVKIENEKGYTIGGIRLTENNIEGDPEVFDLHKNSGFIEWKFDNIFDTNERMAKIYIKDCKTFSTLNHDNVGHVPKECRQLVKEYNSYKALLKYYHEKNYYDCHIMIANYFGHISYGKEFGYFKSHDEIVLILFELLLSSLTEGHDVEGFEKFIIRMMNKIKWNCEHKHNYIIK